MAKLTKVKDWQGQNLDVYKVTSASDVGSGLVRHEWQGENYATQKGTTLTENILNPLQQGLVHSVDAIQTIKSNDEVYEVEIDGLDEFGLHREFKMLMTVDTENTKESPKIELNGIQYELMKEYRESIKSLEARDLKVNKTYNLVYNGNQFVIMNISEVDLAKFENIVGLPFDGNIQDIRNKVVGKFYYDEVTKYYYECIANTNLTYTDGNYFRAISNKPISDRLDNLYETKTAIINLPHGFVKFMKKGKIVFVFIFMDYAYNNIQIPILANDDSLICGYPSGFSPATELIDSEYYMLSRNNGNGEQISRVILRKNGIVNWAIYQNLYEFKGTISYYTD